ncbi:MAG TPA: glycosyltransferase [Candidatus Acidoferrales bacterium]|nr:glycosyltransferase [Candidatus Acidoferrales bacterium]
MMAACEMAFWAGVLWLGYVYLGYPALLWILGAFRVRREPPALGDDDLPIVSVLVSARNEQNDIGWKIAETLGWNYPAAKLEMIVASDASEDGTDEILQGVSDPRFRFLKLETRQGKNEALNRLATLARGDLLFFTDANSHIEPDCLRRMVRHFAGARVGCVTGSERTIRSDEVAMVTGTRAFLEYESLVNMLESRLGSVLVCDGSIFCMRRSLFSTLEPDLANDLELPLHVGAAGYEILFDPEAVSWEKATSVPREEFRRKKRICGQGSVGLWRMRRHVSGLRAWQFLSRKILRWLGVVPLALILLSSVALVRIPLYAIALALQLAFYGLALTGWRLATTRAEVNRLVTLPFYFMTVNVAAFAGVCAAIGGKRFSVWDSPTQSRGQKPDHRACASGTAAPGIPAPSTELRARKYPS